LIPPIIVDVFGSLNHYRVLVISPNLQKKAGYTQLHKNAKRLVATPTPASVSSFAPKMDVFGVETPDWVVRKMVLLLGVIRDHPLSGMDNG
jgi:hypothetical protein